MSVTNINAHSELTMVRELPVGMTDGIALPGDQDSTWADAPDRFLQSAMAALGDGRISEVVAQFDDRFKSNDHALALEFTEKARLTEFFTNRRREPSVATSVGCNESNGSLIPKEFFPRPYLCHCKELPQRAA